MASHSFFVQKSRVDGWKEGRKEGKAGLRIAYSNQKDKASLNLNFDCCMFCVVEGYVLVLLMLIEWVV